MKIRQGFVSNSSSSSFCIYGIDASFNVDDIKDEVWETFVKENNITLDDLDSYSVKDILEDCDPPIYTHCGDNVGDVLGCEPSRMKKDETLAQFEGRIKSSLNKILKEPLDGDFSFINDSFYC